MPDKNQNKDDAAALRDLLRSQNPVTYYPNGLSESGGRVFHKGKPVEVVGDTESGAVVFEAGTGAIALTSRPSTRPVQRSKRRKRGQKKPVAIIYPIKMSFIYTPSGESDQVVFKGGDKNRVDIESVLPSGVLGDVPGYVVRSFRNTGATKDKWEGVFLSPDDSISKVLIVKDGELVTTYILDDILFTTSTRRSFMRSMGGTTFISADPIYFNFDDNQFVTVNNTRSGFEPGGYIYFDLNGGVPEVESFNRDYLWKNEYIAFEPTQTRVWNGTYNEAQGAVTEDVVSSFSSFEGCQYRKLLRSYQLYSNGTINYSLVDEGHIQWLLNDQTFVGINRIEITREETHNLDMTRRRILEQREVRDTVSEGPWCPYIYSDREEVYISPLYWLTVNSDYAGIDGYTMSSSSTGSVRTFESILFPVLGSQFSFNLKRELDDNRTETCSMTGFLTETQTRQFDLGNNFDLFLSTGPSSYKYDAGAIETFTASGSVNYEADEVIYLLEKECLYIKRKQSWTYEDSYTFDTYQDDVDSRSSASLSRILDFARYVYTPHITPDYSKILLVNREATLTRVLTNFAYNAVRSFFDNNKSITDRSDRFQRGSTANSLVEWRYFHIDSEGNEIDKKIDTSDSFCIVSFRHDGDWEGKPLPEEGDVITMSNLSPRLGYDFDQFLSYDWAETCTMTETSDNIGFTFEDSETSIEYSGVKAESEEYTNFWAQIDSGKTECWLVAYGEYVNDSQEFDPYGVPVYVYSCNLDSMTRVFNQDSGAFKRDRVTSIQVTVTSGPSEESVFCLREDFSTVSNNDMKYVVFPKSNAASLLITFISINRSFSSRESIQPYLNKMNLVDGKFFITNEFRTQFRLSNNTDDNGADTFELEGIDDPSVTEVKVKWLKAKNKYTNPKEELIGVTGVSPGGFSSGVNPFVSFYPLQQ